MFKAIKLIFTSLLAAAMVGLVMAWPTTFLWNFCLVDAITFVRPIGLWQAWGITVLINLLFRIEPAKS
jgi:hypothetical protein|tara:strand:+ start:257 stop:460 length:204 start_codon:yes stop_codon:yes gene_type:complete